MLKGLDDIPWGKLTHAYGSADDVPSQLRRLASTDEGARKNVWHQLYGNIYHQGTVYEATAYAVPFLIRLAQTPSVPERDEIMMYIYWLWHGTSYRETHQQYSDFEEVGAPEFQAKLQQELAWVRAVKYAVDAGAWTYAGLLADSAPRVRATAAYLLSLAKGDAKRHINWIRTRLDVEPDEMVWAACIYAIAELAEGVPQAIDWLTSVMNSDARPAARVSASLGLIRALRKDVPSNAVMVVANSLKEPGREMDVLARLPEFGDDLPHSLYRNTLIRAGIAAVPALPAMAVAMERLGDWRVYWMAEAMLTIAFDGEIDPDAGPFSNLTAPQQQVLRAIFDSRAFWASVNEKYHDTFLKTLGLFCGQNIPNRFYEWLREALQQYISGRHEG